MAYAGHYRHSFDAPAPRPKRAKRAALDIYRSRELADLIDLADLIEQEYSDTGRDPRFPSGWYILPGLVLGVAALALLAV
jgi:hypothetical protein